MSTETEFNVEAFLAKISLDAAVVFLGLLNSVDANGGDFGFMSEAREASGFSQHKFAGHIAHLDTVIAYSEDLSEQSHMDCNEMEFGLIYDLNIEDAINTVGAFVAARHN